MEENRVPEGNVEKLEAQVKRYLAEGTDQIFEDYLHNFRQRLKGNRLQADLLQEELNKSYEMYLRRAQLAGRVAVAQSEQVQQAQQQVQPEQAQQSEQAQSAVSWEQCAPQPMAASVKKSSSGAEFMVGTAVLSIVGGAFILTSLVMLGIYFMNGFAKGMLLYGAAILFLAVSELLVHKKWPKLAAVLSSIGICGFYLSTAVNYLSLHNFGMLTAIIISLLITVFVILLSRKRDSFAYRILGLVACHLCLLTVRADSTRVELLVLAGIILLVNIMCIAVPIRRYKTAFHIAHMYTILVFSLFMNLRLDYCWIAYELRAAMVICLVLIMQLILVSHARTCRKEAEVGRAVESTGFLVSYVFCGFTYSVLLAGIFFESPAEKALNCYGSIAAIVVICAAAMAILCKSKFKWYPYYLMNLLVYSCCFTAENEWVHIICLMVLLAIAKLLSLRSCPQVRIVDAVLTTVNCIALLCYADKAGLPMYVLLAGVVLSIPFISRWQTYFEVLLVFTLGFFSAVQLVPMLQLPVFVGLLFVGTLLFNNVKRFRGKHILVYNGLALAADVVCFLKLSSPAYRNAYLTYMAMLLLGIATIVLTFQKKYQMDFKGRNLILAIFVTYMALIVKTNLPVVNSILLMLIALVCVGIGFAVKEKAIRIYGLVLSLTVCGKIVLYDYVGAQTLQKTILFFVVGVIALIISGIYIILEKKNNQ